MARRRKHAGGTLLCCLVALGGPSAADAAEKTPTLAIEARLFGSKTGRLSDDVLGSGGPPLSNVVIADDPSVSTLVTVKVASDAPLGDRARIRLVATEGDRPALWKGPYRPRRLVDKSVARPVLDEGQEAAHVGFWVEPTGCVPIDLRAELLDPPRRPVSASARLAFRCSE